MRETVETYILMSSTNMEDEALNGKLKNTDTSVWPLGVSKSSGYSQSSEKVALGVTAMLLTSFR